jgi:hypothetical protein
MGEKIDVRAVQGILYGIYAALHKIAGDSAAAVMRSAAPEILGELTKLGVDFSDVTDVPKLESMLKETIVGAGLCDDIAFELDKDGKELKTNIANCAFFDLNSHLENDGIPPFGCPFAALTIAVAEKNLGKKARLKTLRPLPGGKKGDSEMVIELIG